MIFPLGIVDGAPGSMPSCLTGVSFLPLAILCHFDFKILCHRVGGEGILRVVFPCLLLDISCRMAAMSCGCAQFLSPHRIKMKCSLFHIFTPLLQWYMSFVFSSAWLNTLGHNGFVHRPLLDITVPVGSFFAVSCTANLCLD